jgi:type I restriction-modification system DNA methylase subunit
MASQEDKEERETQRAIDDLARSVKKIKKKNWEGYKHIYPELYAQEFGIDRSLSPQIQKIVEKAQEKTEDLAEENRRLKEDIKELKKVIKQIERNRLNMKQKQHS